jgi:hypothetical protein
VPKIAHQILTADGAEEYASLEEEVRDFDEPWLIRRGEPAAATFPKGAKVKLTGGGRLADLIDNVHQWLLVSEKVAEILREEPIKIEILPLTLLDRRGRPVPGKYSVANVLGTVDCLDLKKSEYTDDPMDEGLIMAFDRVVLDPKKIPRKPSLFRLKQMPEILIVRSDLVARLEAAGVTGMSFLDLDAPVFL